MTKPLPPEVWRPMTPDERTLAVAASRICFPFGAGQGKRMVAKLAAIATRPNAQITDRQAEALASIIQRYRRQLPQAVVALAIVAGALSVSEMTS